ncbi:hypothetical protein ACG7TL_001492 [Trametes sanguinea]
MDKSAPGAGKRPLPDFPHIAEARQQPMDLESVTPGATARTGPMTGGEMALLRKQTLRRLSTLLTKKFGRGYRVELFGSTLYARSLESDMDVIILDDARPHGFEPGVQDTPPPIYSVEFYGERFDYTTQMISIRHGGIIRRPQHLPPDPEYSHFRGSIVVLDPFLNKNCTRFIKEETLQEFRAKCSVGAADSIRKWESLKARHQTQVRSQSDDEEEPDPWTDLMASR